MRDANDITRSMFGGDRRFRPCASHGRFLPYPKPPSAVKRAAARILAGTLCLALVLSPVAGAAAGDVDLEKEAKRPFVNSIAVIGCAHFSEKELKQKMYTKEPSFFAVFTKPRLRTSYIQRDVAFLEAFYHSQGFFEAKVVLKALNYSEDRRFVDCIIEVDEGLATTVGGIVFQQSSIVAFEKLRKKLILKTGDPFNPAMLETDVYTVKNEYAKVGYPAASVEDSVSYADHSVTIFYSVDPGPKMRIDAISVRGNEMTKGSILEKELTFKQGEVFNLDKLYESRRNLFDTGLFTEVELMPDHIDIEKKSVNISVRVRERKATYVEVGLGVGNVLGSRAIAEWGDRNLFGTGRKLKLKAQYSFDLFENNEVDFDHMHLSRTYVRYDGEFHQRHLFGTKFLTAVNGFFEEDATVEPITIKTIGASVIGNRRLSQYTDLLLSLSHERIRREIPEVPEELSTSRILSASISRDRRDFILNPGSGGYRSLRLDLAGGIFGGDNDFYSILASIQKYFKRGRSTIIALRTRIGYVDAFGSSADRGVPIENRFFAGGGNSVRGYRENSLGPRGIVSDPYQAQTAEGVVGGRVLLLTNAEIRFGVPLLSRIRISAAAFLDGGNVWASVREVKFTHFRPFVEEADITAMDYRYSVGCGLRYNTPVGPIRLDYGVPFKRDPAVDSGGRFHISLGQIF
ncbi:MAG: outer membrane protein assembly factor BamA [Chitinivibrionia bacterium]|nr:outer membrane protein assembly factor BamA [Chitinivibrionia bacterium]